MHADANMTSRGRRPLAHYGAIIGLLLIALVVVEVPKYLPLFLGWRSGVVPWVLASQALMIGLPFFLARIAPTLAGFDRQWFPSAWRQWLWFVGMVILLLVVGRLGGWLWRFHKDWDLFSLLGPIMGDVAPGTVILHAVVLVLLTPIAEELFWRAYLLPQLGKLTLWPIALLIHSLLFSLFHLPTYWNVLLAVFTYGVILGMWRLRFRSLLPLILAHMILNGVALGPHLKAQYDSALQSYSKCRQIDRLSGESAKTAMPVLIAFLGDPNEVVSLYAVEAIGNNYGDEAEPYLAEALASGDDRTVYQALFVIELYDYSGLKPQVRAVAWSSENIMNQLSAVTALHRIKDEEGLRDIEQKHPDERVRNLARDMLSR